MSKIFFIFLFAFHFSIAQDIFDTKNSKKYGLHLLNSAQYPLAIAEWERLHYLLPTDDSIKINLVKAYRLSQKNSEALDLALKVFPEFSQQNAAFGNEFLKTAISAGKWSQAEKAWEQIPGYSAEQKTIFKSTSLVYDDKLKLAKTLLSSSPKTDLVQSYINVLDRTYKHKSPAAAGLLSTLIPGLGRWYARDLKDGIVSLLFTAGMGIQAYRGFDKLGFNKPRGYIYGAVATGFYLGNIYGSVQSAKAYNRKNTDQTKHEISTIFNAQF
jgi:hypothetical protein